MSTEGLRHKGLRGAGHPEGIDERVQARIDARIETFFVLPEELTDGQHRCIVDSRGLATAFEVYSGEDPGDGTEIKIEIRRMTWSEYEALPAWDEYEALPEA